MSYRRRYYRRYRNSKTSIDFVLFIIALPFICLWYCIKLLFTLILKITNSRSVNGNIKGESYNNDEYDNSYMYENDKSEQEDENRVINNLSNDIKYQQKESLITNYEKYFYNIFEKNFGEIYKIQTQVNLASVVSKVSQTRYQNELYRNIDFGFFEKETLKPLLLIEINDSTHRRPERYERDLKVRNILSKAGIKLLTFYSFYDNQEDYIVSRIKKTLAE